MTDADHSPRRFHDLDALRGLAMFLGIVLHSSVFVSGQVNPIWPIHIPETSGDNTYQRVIEIIHCFRMPVFFLLSGFFTALLLERRSLITVATLRLQRIGIPLAIGCFTILPLSIWLFAVAGNYAEPYDFPLWLLPLVWFRTIGHLWFLWYLLLIVGCFILATQLGLRFRHQIWWLVIPSSMILSLMMVKPIYGADNVFQSLPDGTIFAYYTCFFVFGAFFYRKGFAVRRWWVVALLPAAVAFWAGFHLLDQYKAMFEGFVPDAFMYENPLSLASTLIETVCTWLMCFGLMGLFHWILSRENFAVRYFSDASYWMYLMHLPLVIAAQLLVLDWPIHYHLKFFLICTGVTLILLITYQFGVRYTIIGKTLNGPRTRRQAQQL